jgi:hypothetical protein
MFRFLRSPKSTKSRLHSSKPRLGVEALEDRAVPAILIGSHLPQPEVVTASLGRQGVLTITGTNQDDQISVGQKNGRIYVSGIQNSFSIAAVSRIDINGKAGNDVIRLDGAGLGAAPIAKPTIVHGGDGNDVLIGGFGNDIMFGDAGNDFMIGNAGNDIMTGGTGKDQMYGGAGSDLIAADFDDGTLAGQAGNDQVVFNAQDPAPLAAGNPNAIETAAQLGLNGKSYSITKYGATLTVDHMTVTAVDVSNGVTTLTIKARLKGKVGSGWASVSESGDMTFTVQPKLSALFVEGHVQSASIKLTNVSVRSIHLDNVPGWMTNNDFVRDFLSSKLQNLPTMPLTAQLQAYLAMGGSIGPTVQA